MLRTKLLILLVAAASIASFHQTASAVSSADWVAGNIISDAIFYDNTSMSVTDIQSFLDTKVTSCDINGTQPASDVGYPNMTHAQYAAMVGWPGPPYVCLKYYYQVPDSTKIVDNYSGSIPAGSQSAAQIIKNASDNWGVNPKVILATLQKESLNILYDTWPMQSQYKNSMGYGCPDTAPCDSQYAGFYNQVNNAAWQFKQYRVNSANFRYKPFQSNNIYYNPNLDACGYSGVYVQGYATAGLYNYTPYQPNQAALNNLYGSGDNCSAYGNRNFWRIFSDFFGSTRAPNANVVLSSNLNLSSNADVNNVQQGDTLTASFDVSNTATYDMFVGGLGVCARIDNQYYDFGFIDRVTIPASGKTTVSFSKKIDRPGTINLFMCSYSDAVGGWASTTYPYNTSGYSRTASRYANPNPLVSTSPSTDISTPMAGQPTTATFTLINNSTLPVNVGDLIIAARDGQGKNVDFPAATNVTIPARSTYTYSKARVFDNPGDYTLFVAQYQNGAWSGGPGVISGIRKNLSLHVTDNPAIVSSVKVTPTPALINQPTTASFSIKNGSTKDVYIGDVVVAVRDNNGNNVDFPIDPSVTIPANSTYTYTKSREFSTAGSNYHAFYANYKDGAWSTGYPKRIDSNIGTVADFSVTSNPVVSSSVSVSPAEALAGQPITALVTLQNKGPKPASIGDLVIAARDSHGLNVDFPVDPNVIVPANGTYTYSKSRVLPDVDQYKLFIATYDGNKWSTSYPTSDSSNILRTLSISTRANPLITTGLTVTPSNPTINQLVTVSMTLRNDGTQPVDVGQLVIAGRDSSNGNFDFPSDTSTIVPAGSSIVYSKSRTFSASGLYSIFIADYKSGVWSRTYPASLDSKIPRSAQFRVSQ